MGVTTSKRQTSILQMFSLHSPDDSYDEAFLANYISINLKPEILRISGVGDMMIMGGDYSLRIWMKPDVMAQYRLIPRTFRRCWRNRTSSLPPDRSARTPTRRTNTP